MLSDSAVVHFSRGIPPPEAIPSDDLAMHTAAVLTERRDEVFQYAPIGRNQGDPALRQQLGLFHDVDPDDIFVGSGSLQVLDLLARLLLADGNRHVCVEAPTYDRAIGIFGRHHADIVGIPLQEDGLDVDRLEDHLRRRVPAFLYTIPDFQNPSGVTLSEGKRRKLVDLSARYGFVVIEDIPYRQLRYHGAAIPSLRELAGEAPVITLGSLSKILSPGLRVGYAISERAMSEALASLAESTYLSAVPLCQAVAARCLAEGAVHLNILRVREIVGPRHDAGVATASRLLGDHLLAIPNGGYYLAAHLPVATDEQSLLAAARSRGVQLTSGSAFYPPSAAPPAGTHFVRLPFQALDPHDFAAGLDRLSQLATAEMIGP